MAGCLLAERNGEILGFLGYAKLFFFEADGSYYRILALSVAKETRRQGIASRLIDELKKQAVKEGVEALALNSGLTAERNAAHQFYQAVGFEKVTACFALHLKTQHK
ncbi:Protein export cytoplasm protein SecA ATPase RNA helicase [Streptococcus sp. ZB199]|nr:Protein export cytoplasm protein SecA ATPase RNA helicase [Streptococcus sp. ZB199]